MVVSSSMLRQWMVAWLMGKFTYAIAQDSVHRRYEQHISTTTILLVIFNYFCSEAYFCIKNLHFICVYHIFLLPLQANQMKTVKTLHFDFYLCWRISFCFIRLCCVAGRLVTALLCVLRNFLGSVDFIQSNNDNKQNVKYNFRHNKL